MQVDQTIKAPVESKYHDTFNYSLNQSKRFESKKKTQKVQKISVKNKVISKGTSYSDKYEARRKMRLGTKMRNLTGKTMNKLGQKHKVLKISAVHGMALTKAQKKQILKKKKREDARNKKHAKATMSDDDWESASSDEEEVKAPEEQMVAEQ